MRSKLNWSPYLRYSDLCGGWVSTCENNVEQIGGNVEQIFALAKYLSLLKMLIWQDKRNHFLKLVHSSVAQGRTQRAQPHFATMGATKGNKHLSKYHSSPMVLNIYRCVDDFNNIYDFWYMLLDILKYLILHVKSENVEIFFNDDFSIDIFMFQIPILCQYRYLMSLHRIQECMIQEWFFITKRKR